MKQKNDQSRKQHTSADELICDYLNDILGNDQPIVMPEISNETQSISNFLTEQKNASVALEYTESTDADDAIFVEPEVTPFFVEPEVTPFFVEPEVTPLDSFYDHQKNDCSLIPTIKLHHSTEPQRLHTQEESMIILLTNLYYLRRPLPPKVRQCFLDLSERAIDDFHASKWLNQADMRSVLSEA